MSKKELIEAIEDLHKQIDDSVDELERAALEAQEAIYKEIIKQIEYFEIRDGRYIVNQDFKRRFAILENKMTDALGDIYIPAVSEYLNIYTTIEQTNVALQKSYNDLVVDIKTLTPARKTVYDAAEHYLSKGLKDVYVQPAKYLLMQHVTTGITIKDSRRVLDRWNDGDKVGDITPVPNLAKYSVQLSRDAAYQYNGAINGIIADQYGLDKFIYVGDIIEHSRPLCRHLVNLDRDIEMSELPEILKKYPQGLYPGTNTGNFIQRRGGYGCRHEAFPVR